MGLNLVQHGKMKKGAFCDVMDLPHPVLAGVDWCPRPYLTSRSGIGQPLRQNTPPA